MSHDYPYIDECTLQTDNCGQGVICNNEQGSYNCSGCLSGYIGSGSICSDANECANPVCTYDHMECQNLIGESYMHQ